MYQQKAEHVTFSLMENVEFFVSPSIPMTRGLFLPSLASAVPYATRVATCTQNNFTSRSNLHLLN